MQIFQVVLSFKMTRYIFKEGVTKEGEFLKVLIRNSLIKENSRRDAISIAKA
jgi:hypothetical protein